MFYFDDFFGKKVLKSTFINCNHFFTTRDFILHAGSLACMEAQAALNVDFLIQKLKVKPENLYRCRQMHTSNVEFAKGDVHCFDNTDGIILTEPASACFLNFADCIPIILYDERKNIGGVIHAGWRGTASQIVKNAVNMMLQHGSVPKDISAAIGPGIDICCFDVNKDVFEKITQYLSERDLKTSNLYSFCEATGKFFVNLKLINKIWLNQSSVNRVDVSDYCTSCCNEVFFSYRKENGNTARHSAVLKIKE